MRAAFVDSTTKKNKLRLVDTDVALSHDRSVAFGSVSDDELVALTVWATMVFEEDTVGYAASLEEVAAAGDEYAFEGIGQVNECIQELLDDTDDESLREELTQDLLATPADALRWLDRNSHRCRFITIGKNSSAKAVAPGQFVPGREHVGLLVVAKASAGQQDVGQPCGVITSVDESGVTIGTGLTLSPRAWTFTRFEDCYG